MSDDLRDAVVAAAGRVPGVAVAIVDADGVRSSVGVGSADLASGRPASPEMVCPWFSMTKIVTATLTMRMAERGLLDLDAPVFPGVPQLARLRPRAWAERITPRHLLSHAAGIANPIPVSWIHRPGEPGPDPASFLDTLLAKHPKLRFEPGARSSYSNLGTLVLGEAVRAAGGAPYIELAEREVLVPLGMASTGFAYSELMAGAGATGYHPRRSPMRLLLPRWVIGPPSGRWVSLRRFLLDGAAYGGLLGPVSDAARFLRLHLRDGELDGTRLLSETAARSMREISVPGRRYDLGLGWFRPADRRDADPPFVEHLGGGAGFYNVMRVYPTRGVGIVAMGNATSYAIDRVAALALRS